MAIMSMTVTSAARSLSHLIAFAVTILLLGIIVGFVGMGIRERFGSHFNRFGPFYLICLSAPLIMADLVRHALQDSGLWLADEGSAEYRDNCQAEDWSCLSTVGWLFTIVFTYVGFAVLFVATMWNAHIIQQLKKIRAKWRELRGKPPLP